MAFAGLRVGLVGPLPPPAGGMANQTRQLAELLDAARACVAMVQTNAPYRPHWVARLAGVRALVRLAPYLLSLWRITGRSDVIHLMANSGWSWHLFAAPAIWVAWMRRVPVVVNYRGGEADTFLAGSANLVRWSMARAAKLVVPSAFLREVFERYGMTATVVPNVVDLHRFRPAVALAEDDPHLLVARNLEPLYDNATALRAFAILHAQLPRARLTLAGTGPEAQALKALATNLGVIDAVHFSGRLDPEAMAALYRRSTLSLNPSLADNMPNSILESLASGVPVVSTDVGGVPFLVEDGVTALLVKPGDPHAMAEAALRLVRDPALARRLAAAGLQEAQRYAWARVAPMLSDVYRSAVRRVDA